MNTPYELVIFDWEGTISDPLGHVHEAIAAEAEVQGFGVYDMQLGRQYVSLGLEKSVRKLFPDLSLHQYENLLQGIQQRLIQSHATIYLFPGARDVIEGLHHRGITLAIATNKNEQSLERDLQASGLQPFFSTTVSASTYPAKPSPEMLHAVLNKTGGLHENSLMIGDSIADMEMAQALDMHCIGVDFYFHDADDLMAAGAQDVFHDFEQIRKYLAL